MSTKIGIDLSLRSTGLCAVNDVCTQFSLIQPNNNDYNDELLIKYNSKEILKFLEQFEDIESINLEGLSFGSSSGSKDILAGNFWYLRCVIKDVYPDVTINIVPVLSWRSPLFNKEERLLMKKSSKAIDDLKNATKGIPRKEKMAIYKQNEDIFLASNIKEQTYLKLPDNIKEQICNITQETSKYDLTDLMVSFSLYP